MVTGVFLLILTVTGAPIGPHWSLVLVGPFLRTAGFSAASSASCFCIISITPGFVRAIGSMSAMSKGWVHVGHPRLRIGMSLLRLFGSASVVPHLPQIMSGIVSPPFCFVCFSLFDGLGYLIDKGLWNRYLVHLF